MSAMDGGYSWIVLLASFALNMLFNSIPAAVSVLKVEMVQQFRVSWSQVAWMAAIVYGIRCTGVFYGGLIHKYGCRPVCMISALIAALGMLMAYFSTTFWAVLLSYSVLGGLGCLGMTLSSFVALQYHFDQKLHLATGIALIGGNSAVLLILPFYGYLAGLLGWRYLVAIHSAVVLQGVVFGALLRPAKWCKTAIEPLPESTKIADPVTRSHFCDVTLFKSLAFVLFVTGNVLVTYGHQIVNLESITRAVLHGVSLSRASLMGIAIGVGVMVGRSYVALFGSHADPTLTYSLMAISGGFVMIMIASVTSFTLSLVVVGLYSTTSGVYTTLAQIVTLDLLGRDLVAKGQGWCMTVVSIAQITALPIAGWIYDVTGNYDLPFYLGGIAQACGGFMLLLIYIIDRCSRTKHSNELTDKELVGETNTALSYGATE